MHWIYEYLSCPVCSGDLKIEPVDETGHLVCEGTMKCKSCEKIYPIINTIPRLVEDSAVIYEEFYKKHGIPIWNPSAESRLFKKTMESYQKWHLEILSPFIYKELQAKEILINRCLASTENISGKVVLDAGTGHGAYLRPLMEMKAKYVIGMDLGRGVEIAWEKNQDMPNLLVIQGNIMKSPVKENKIDFAISHGVLHHTPDPEKAFGSLAGIVKENGQMGIYVYWQGMQPYDERPQQFKKLLWRHIIIEPIRRGITNLSHRNIMMIAKSLFAVKKWINAVYRILGVKWMVNISEKIIPYDLSEGKSRFVSRCYDSLSTKYLFNHNNEEVINWFINNGFDELQVGPYPVSILGKKKPGNRGEIVIHYHQPKIGELPYQLKSQ